MHWNHGHFPHNRKWEQYWRHYQLKYRFDGVLGPPRIRERIGSLSCLEFEAHFFYGFKNAKKLSLNKDYVIFII